MKPVNDAFELFTRINLAKKQLKEGILNYKDDCMLSDWCGCPYHTLIKVLRTLEN